MGELMRAMEQILALPKKDLTKPELEFREAYELEQMRQEGDDTAHVGQPQKIEVAHSAQLFKLPDGSSGGLIDVVILGSIVTRANYVSREPEAGVLCQSIGGKYGKPSNEGYALLANDIPDLNRMQVLCVQCPFGANDFGTDGAGKKCKEMRKLLVFHKGSKKPLLLNIPPTSIRAFDSYYDSVDGSGKLLMAMMTRIKLVERKKGQQVSSNFVFEAGPSIPPDQFVAAKKLRDMYQDSIRSVDVGDYYQVPPTMEDTEAVEADRSRDRNDDLPF